MKKIILIMTCLAALGCESPDWTSPEYVSKVLTEKDASEVRMALDKLGGESDELKKGIVPALIQVYNKKGANQKKAMALLVEIRSTEAKDVYLSELQSNAVGYASAAAAALGDAKIKEAIPDLLKVLAATANPDAKVGILQALGKMPDPKSVKPMIELLKLDVDNNPIKVHSYACDALGDIALKFPNAFDAADIKQITLAVFFGNNMGQSLDLPCGLAIQKIGKQAIPELAKIFKGERADVKKLMLKYDTPKSPFPSNTPKLISAKRLARLHAAVAEDLFLADLKSVKAAPKTLTGASAVNYRVKEAMITAEILRDLGDLKAAKAAPFLAELVEGKHVNEEWDDITDGMIELQFRQDAGFALVQIGDRKFESILLKMADEGVVNDFEKRAAMLSKKKKVKDVERYQFNWMMAKFYALLNEGNGAAGLQKIIDKNKKGYANLSIKMATFLPVIELAKTCNAKGDDEAKAACYDAKMTALKPEIREKAVFEIARLPADIARKYLLKNLGTRFLDTRMVISSSLYHVADKSVAEAAMKLIEKETTKGGAPYKMTRIRLKLLHAYAAKK